MRTFGFGFGLRGGSWDGVGHNGEMEDPIREHAG